MIEINELMVKPISESTPDDPMSGFICGWGPCGGYLCGEGCRVAGGQACGVWCK